MLKTLARLLCLLSALVVVEAHLLVGQSAAWLAMIHSRTPAMGLAASISNTFSGQHPCTICTLIQAERSDSSDQKGVAPVTSSLGKFLASGSIEEPRISYLLLTFRPLHPCSETGATPWSEDVPHPPPRRT